VLTVSSTTKMKVFAVRLGRVHRGGVALSLCEQPASHTRALRPTMVLLSATGNI